MMKYSKLLFRVGPCDRKLCVVNALIQFGALVNIKDCHGNNVLHSAINSCWREEGDTVCLDKDCLHFLPDMDIIEYLLRHESIDVNARNSKGYTPLLWAVKYNYKGNSLENTVKALISKAADVNIGDSFHVTPLHAAVSCMFRDSDVASELVLHGACVTCSDDIGLTPLDLVFQPVMGPKSYKFADKFVRQVSFIHPDNELIRCSLQSNSQLLELHIRCSEEVHRMRNQIIAWTNTLYDFVYHRLKGSNISASEVDTSRDIVNSLRSGSYPIYFEKILNCMFKNELYKLLVLEVVTHRYKNMSHQEIFESIVALNTSKSNKKRGRNFI